MFDFESLRCEFYGDQTAQRFGLKLFFLRLYFVTDHRRQCFLKSSYKIKSRKL